MGFTMNLVAQMVFGKAVIKIVDNCIGIICETVLQLREISVVKNKLPKYFDF